MPLDFYNLLRIATMRLAYVGSLLGAFALGCSRATPTTTRVELDAGVDAATLARSGSASAAGGAAPAFDAENALWLAAAALDEAALARLASHVGAAGLEEAAETAPARLPTALRAAGYAEGLHATAWLARGVLHGGAEREPALLALHEIAQRKRQQRDPEDAAEVKAACTALAMFANGSEGTAEERARTVAILRMLAEYGCMMRSQITDKLDSK